MHLEYYWTSDEACRGFYIYILIHLYCNLNCTVGGVRLLKTLIDGISPDLKEGKPGHLSGARPGGELVGECLVVETWLLGLSQAKPKVTSGSHRNVGPPAEALSKLGAEQAGQQVRGSLTMPVLGRIG